MAKFTLLTNPACGYMFLPCPWVKELCQDYFDIEPYTPGTRYNPNHYAVLINYVEQLERSAWYQQAQELGLKIAVEHLRDSDVDRGSYVKDGILTVRCPNWMWYNACLEWQYYGLDQYEPKRDYRHSFLMPMNQPRWHRDLVIKELESLLPEAMYSYCSRGLELPGTPPNNMPWRNYLNPEWYDHTPYSVVVESYMRSRAWSTDPLNHNYKTEVSEKLFKPMLGQQPFIVYGSADTLKYLHREGFVTYDNLWDESYDSVVEDLLRFHTVTHTVQQAVANYPYTAFDLDSATLERIQHNRARLFDHALVVERFQAEVVQDIVNWFNE